MSKMGTMGCACTLRRGMRSKGFLLCLLAGKNPSRCEVGGVRLLQIGAAASAGVAATGAADLVIRVEATGTEPPPHDGLVVWSKADLQALEQPVPDGVLVTSSRTGAGLGALVAAVMAKLVPEADEPGLLDGAVPFLPRHLEALNRVMAGEPVDGGRRLQ